MVDTERQLLTRAGHQVARFMAHNPSGAGAAPAVAVAAWNAAAADRLNRVVAETRPDVVHVHNTWFALSPAIFSTLHRQRIPTVLTLHNYRLICAAATLFRDGGVCTDCVGDRPWHAVRHACYRDSRPMSMVAASTIELHQRTGTWHRHVDRFLALSQFGRDRFIEGGLPADRIEVKSNSVPDPGPRSRDVATAREVVYLGRLAPEKGISLLLEAWHPEDHGLELVVVGSGPQEPQLRAMAPPRVRFHGQLPADEVRALLLRARALVFPSLWYEGQGLVALEAAAAGLPVVLSDLGVMSALFAPHADELLFAPGDPVALRDALARLGDDDFVQCAGQLTRRVYEQRYTHQRALERLESVYAAVQ